MLTVLHVFQLISCLQAFVADDIYMLIKTEAITTVAHQDRSNHNSDFRTSARVTCHNV